MKNMVAPGRLERPSPTLQVGVLPVGRQSHLVATCGFKPRSSESKSLTGPQATPVACSGLRPDPVRPAVGRHGMVAGGGIEPPTFGFRDRRSATELTRSVGGPTGLEPAYLEPQSSALPLSYSPHENWSDRPDLNRRPLPPQGSALPD